MLPMIRRTLVRDPAELFDREFGRLARRFFSDEETANGANTASYPVDIREDENSFHVEAELPGYRKDDVDITLENGVLTITAERKQETAQPGQVHLNERRYTRTVRSFNLPKTVDENNVEARLNDGLLHLTIHKKEEVKPRKIEVQ